MVLRVLGLKEEATYGESMTGKTPDWHRRVSDGSFKLNDEPVIYNDGSRMAQGARPGAVKPTGSTAGKTDLKRIGHFLKAFLDEYVFTEGEDDDDPNVHEFYGREGQYLTSFSAWATFDYFEKLITGLLLDTLKLEVSSDFMTQSEDWIYKNETIRDKNSTPSFNQSTYNVREVAGEIPVMFYDVQILLNGSSAPGVNTSFSFEGKNNLNQDGTVGIGSRFPQIKAAAQKREISMSLVSYLSSETVNLIKAAEYGEVNISSPSNCKLYKIPLKVIIQTCENSVDKLEMLFPECTVAVEYSASESDEIETTFNLTALGTGTVTLEDGETVVQTDCYCKLVNDVGEISPSS